MLCARYHYSIQSLRTILLQQAEAQSTQAHGDLMVLTTIIRNSAQYYFDKPDKLNRLQPVQMQLQELRQQKGKQNALNLLFSSLLPNNTVILIT